MLMNDFEIVSVGRSCLASDIADKFKKTVLSLELTHFADTESHIKLSNDIINIIKDKSIFLVYQFEFASDKFINDQLFSSILLVNLLKKVGVEKIVLCLPYLPYSRSDKSDYGNFIGDIDLVCNILKLAGVESLISCDLHAPKIKDLVDLDILEVDMTDFWTDLLKEEGFSNISKDICLVSPDKGAMERNRKVAVELAADFAFIEKVRVKADLPMMFSLHGNVKGKTVIILDDIIDTARTSVSACDLLLKHGAKKVIGCFTHAVLSDGAVDRIEQSKFEKVFVTDSVALNVSSGLSKKFSVKTIGDFLCQKISMLKI